jgi:hypothetical protein
LASVKAGRKLGHSCRLKTRVLVIERG